MNQVLKETVFPGGQRLQLVRGDITREHVDAIVNAANSHLMHGGGVAGAIVSRGGEAIQEESTRWVKEHGLAAPDRPAVTGAGKLPCDWVIHAVGPIWGEGNEEVKLKKAIQSALRVADELELHSLSLPAISTGIFGFPLGLAVKVIFTAIQNYFDAHPASGLSLVRLVVYDQPSVEAFLRGWQFRFV